MPACHAGDPGSIPGGRVDSANVLADPFCAGAKVAETTFALFGRAASLWCCSGPNFGRSEHEQELKSFLQDSRKYTLVEHYYFSLFDVSNRVLFSAASS